MLANSSTLCQFGLMSFSVTELAEALKAATGFDYDLNELMECGERIWMIQRCLNNLMGITAADDRLPKKMLTPTSEGGAAGSVPNVELLLKEYYKARGLDANGRPLKDKLNSLGLSALAAKL
jgi:aldehyde:ferredoxin oxidoreductase